jgi:hypothetical protein
MEIRYTKQLNTEAPIQSHRFLLGCLLGLASLLMSCQPEPSTSIQTQNSSTQRIYFVYHFMNYNQPNSGFLIDSAGNMYCFSRIPSWINSPGQTHNSALPAATLNAMLNNSQRICGQIPKIKLAQMISLIPATANGYIPAPAHEIFDMGSFKTFAFTYNHQAQTYQPILLKELGEYRSENDAPEAHRLNNWLWSLHP